MNLEELREKIKIKNELEKFINDKSLEIAEKWNGLTRFSPKRNRYTSRKLEIKIKINYDEEYVYIEFGNYYWNGDCYEWYSNEKELYGEKLSGLHIKFSYLIESDKFLLAWENKKKNYIEKLKNEKEKSIKMKLELEDKIKCELETIHDELMGI